MNLSVRTLKSASWCLLRRLSFRTLKSASWCMLRWLPFRTLKSASWCLLTWYLRAGRFLKETAHPRNRTIKDRMIWNSYHQVSHDCEKWGVLNQSDFWYYLKRAEEKLTYWSVWMRFIQTWKDNKLDLFVEGLYWRWIWKWIWKIIFEKPDFTFYWFFSLILFVWEFSDFVNT